MVPIMFTGKTQNYLHHGPLKLENTINKIQSMVIFIVQISLNFDKEIPLIKEKFMKDDCPLHFINM